jgi:hypothetical protein
MGSAWGGRAWGCSVLAATLIVAGARIADVRVAMIFLALAAGFHLFGQTPAWAATIDLAAPHYSDS